MNIQSAGALLISAMIATAAMGAVTTTVVDVPTRPGVTQRFLYVRPDAPLATIVSLAGGDGVLGIMNDGTMTTDTAACNPVARNRLAFAARGYALALVDQTSDFQVYGYVDVREVVRYVRNRDNIPTWIIGGSSSTAAVLSFGIELPLDEPMGVIFFSPDKINVSRGALLMRPALVVFHVADPSAFPGQVYGALTSAPAKQLVGLFGGTNGGTCGYYHLFFGIDDQFVGTVAGFMDTYTGSLVPPAAVDLNQHGLTGSWYTPATSGQGFEVEVFPNPSSGTGSTFVSWFTYDSVIGGAERQRWYTAQGPVVTGQPNASLTIYQNTGGNFNAPPLTNGQAVGTATLSFDTCSSGQLSYSFTDGTGRTGNIALTRLTQNVTCSTTSARPTNADFAYSGNWFDAATSGQGLTVEVNPNSSTAFLAWYTYAPGGASAGAAGQRWYTAQPTTFAPGSRSIPVQIYETTGGMFNAPTPPGQKSVVVGSGTMAFQSCSAATFSYNFTAGSSSGRSGTIALSRVGPVPPGCTS
jgi:hypothetical protein